ncbi:MAG: DNA integrity scanning protein DisA nucleotide-binding domain protein [Ignavibacteria bacterium]|nr:DNA integrity scanning protein DisA nucleotide-binding domain protein [Ignavibacteria bacterium]
MSLENTLTKLDSRLKPDVYLVGVLAEYDSTDYPACVEPEREHWIHSEAYNSALTIAADIRQKYKENTLRQSHPIAQEQQDEMMRRRSVKDAVESITRERMAELPQPSEVYVSLPQRVRKYLVSVVVILPTDILSEYHSLQTARVSLHSHRDILVTRSLVEASIHVLFDRFYEELDSREPSQISLSSLVPEEVLRSAGRMLMLGIACRVEMRGGTFSEFYDCICRISSLRYERRESSGCFIVAKREHPLLTHRLVFHDPVRLTETRHMRKMLELGSGNSALHINHEHAFALTDLPEAASDSEDMFTIRIVGHHHWVLFSGNDIIMGSLNGQPYLHKADRFEGSLRDDLPRLFREISKENVERVVSLVREAAKAKHGALIVISEKANQEAQRLKAQSTTVEPVLLDAALLADITEIDGAIMLDSECRCHAIGVILDGMATTSGDRSRGSRYNSAMKYVQSRLKEEITTIAIVVSEDRTVDTLPHIKPRVRRSLVVSAINQLQDYADGSAAIRNYNSVLDTLDRYRFYLLNDDCERINSCIATVEEKHDKLFPNRMRILRKPFVVDDSMNEEFYYFMD